TPVRPDACAGSDAGLSIMRDSSGGVWVGTDGDGVYQGTFGANGRLSFSDIELWPGAVGNVMCLIEDSRGNIYAGCFLDGIGRYDAASRCFRPLRLTGRDGSVLPVAQANTMTESPDGKLWVGTNGSGVLVVDPSTGVTDILRHESGAAATRTICGNSIHSICFDHNGDIWVGSSDAGLTRISKTDGKYEHFNLANRRLASNCVYSIIEDKGGQIWVSTGGGLARISPAGTTTTYNEASGLPSSQIFGVLQGRDKELWLSTVDGLIRFNPESYALPVTAGRRVRCREFKRGAAFADNSGLLWFGGVGGMVSFDPLTIDNERLPAPPVSFTTLSYKRISDSNPAQTNTVTVPMGGITEIRLPHDSNSMQVEFSAIEFNRPDEINYAYRLEGYHDSWQALPQGLYSITLTDLPPGSYRLTLNADAGEGAPATSCSIPLTIAPPFYLSAFAKGVYVALLAILIATGTILLRRRLHHRNEVRRLEHEENLAQEKLQFFTDISHEIRTPLTLILSPIATLKKQARDSATLRTYEMMESNGDRILRMIGQIIDLRKFDNGRANLEVAPVDIRGFIGQICSSFSDIIHRLGIDFSIEVADEVPANVLIDADKIDKVVFNVLTNAFRFTPKGGTVRLCADIDGTGSLRIRISDTGSGIAEEYREAIFERFYQVKGTGNRGGTGIGLHLSRKMMAAHHGSIYVESCSPEGTVFAIVLPLDRAEYSDAELAVATTTTTDTHRPSLGEVCPDAPATPAAPQSPKAHTVLIVEDDAAIRSYIADNLRGTYNVAEAADGNEGLEAAIRLRPHCIVTDLMMPGLDGLEMCRKIRDNHDICEIPVVMLTAKATDAQRLEGIEAGADSYITKPFNISHLMTQVAMLIHSRRIMKQKFTGTEPVNAEVAALKSGDEKLLERVEAAVIKDLANPELSVEYIAAEIGVSRSHLHRRLKVLTNMSPSAYIKKARMRHAARLLTEKNLAVSEVAYATGFSSLSHFSTVFKEFYGMSPTRYIATKGNAQQ
ncbi:MAG: response regulator, partial [Muribaculaceae bacterium]|nr:response regulator [Muribaculaceae bacterium]